MKISINIQLQIYQYTYAFMFWHYPPGTPFLITYRLCMTFLNRLIYVIFCNFCRSVIFTTKFKDFYTFILLFSVLYYLFFYFTENLALHQPQWQRSTWRSGTWAERAVDRRYTDLCVYREQCVVWRQTINNRLCCGQTVHRSVCVRRTVCDVRQTTTAGGWIKEEYRTYTTCSYNI